MSVIALVAVYNLENLMTNPDFRIIGSGVANINFVNLNTKNGGCEVNSIGLRRKLGDNLE